MAVAEIKAVFPYEIERVWETVTSLDNYRWRSDISRIEYEDPRKFTEYSKDGFATAFTVTCKDNCRRWEFDLENENIKGHWRGVFSETEKGTQVEFTEEVNAKKAFMKPFVKMFLKKQQKRYIDDLKKALESK